MSTYYVKTNGDNTKNGSSWALAFKELVKAEETASDGDIVKVESGVYAEPSVSNGSSGVITFVKTITWQADDGEGNSGVVLVKAKTGSTPPSSGGATVFTGILFQVEPVSQGTVNTVTEPTAIGTTYTTTE